MALRTLPKRFRYVYGKHVRMYFACNPAEEDLSEIWGSIKPKDPSKFQAFCRRINGDRLLKTCASLEAAKRFIRQNAEIEVAP